MRLWRVFPWLPAAAESEPGHPLHVHPRQGAGRVDNPSAYLVLYAADDPLAAIAASFGQFATWTPEMLGEMPILPGSRRALVELAGDFDIDAGGVGAPSRAILDLDSAAALQARGLKPSQVVTRDRVITQRWALQVHGEARWLGVRWWGYYEPAWGSYGIWARHALRVVSVRALEDDLELVHAARERIVRAWHV